MDSFWIAQIRDLLEHMSPDEVKQALRASLGKDHLELDKIMALVDRELTAGLKGLTKRAQALYEIWVNIKGTPILFSRPKSEEEKTQHLIKLLYEQRRKKEDITVRRAQSFDYVGFGQDQMQSNFATPNSEGETGPGTSVGTDGMQGPGGSYFQKALTLKERAKRKREEEKRRREQRMNLVEKLSQAKEPPKPGGKIRGKPGDQIQNVEDTIEDAKTKITKDIDTVSREVGDTEDSTGVSTDNMTNKTKKVKDKSKEMGDTVKQISDETEDNANKIEDSTDKANQAVEKLEDTLDRLT